ncbi:hypothetical protein EVAR_21377_1 [Eumeta japonica]|uniref:DDE Tnp4 domain-containing protein n=1 Tax=Eumeta variegata TaxID=151549 RepID=A0A4C1YAS7_EUMVA|nr:hypothetical protein EVAR_21377_1 [Eumeta japonica]
MCRALPACIVFVRCREVPAAPRDASPLRRTRTRRWPPSSTYRKLQCGAKCAVRGEGGAPLVVTVPDPLGNGRRRPRPRPRPRRVRRGTTAPLTPNKKKSVCGLICDNNLKILSVNPKYGGASHDNFIFTYSLANTYLNQIYESGERGWLIGEEDFRDEEVVVQDVNEEIDLRGLAVP